jgi:hypothetical protein
MQNHETKTMPRLEPGQKTKMEYSLWKLYTLILLAMSRKISAENIGDITENVEQCGVSVADPCVPASAAAVAPKPELAPATGDNDILNRTMAKVRELWRRRTETLAAALDYASKGYPVFPCNQKKNP